MAYVPAGSGGFGGPRGMIIGRGTGRGGKNKHWVWGEKNNFCGNDFFVGKLWRSELEGRIVVWIMT